MDEEENEEFTIAVPEPNGILDPDKYEEESSLVRSWVDKAREEGSILQDESATGRGIITVVKCAERNQLTAEYTHDEALMLAGWVCGWASGVSFEQFRHKAIAAQALMGMVAQIMPEGLLENIDKALEEAEENGDPGDQDS